MKRGRGSREVTAPLSVQAKRQTTPLSEQAKPLLGWYGSTDPAWRTLLEAIPESLAPNIELLRHDDVFDWLTDCEPASNKRLLLGLEHRNDHQALTLLKQLGDQPPTKQPTETTSTTTRKKSGATSPTKPTPSRNLAIAAVLGEDWQGHRRTFPLPDSLETFYWYQWFDGVLPWIHTSDLQPTHSQTLSPRVGRIIDRSDQAKAILRTDNQHSGMQLTALQELGTCWVLSDEPTNVALWQSLLGQYGIRTIGSLTEDAWPAFQADCIFYAPESRPAQAPTDANSTPAEPNPRIVSDLQSLRDEHPTSFIVLIHPFLRWNDWPTFHNSGADAIACPPCSLEGILTTWFLHR